jgi:hypothetical protein
MSYLIAAYAVTLGALVVYGAALMRERGRYRAQRESDSNRRPTN